MKSEREMDKHHRINVWRIANCCPVCGSERDYFPANPNGIECYCSNDNCCYSELFSNVFIHTYGTKNDAARFEVLDHNNEVRAGWIYHPMEWERQSMDICIQKRKEDKKDRKKINTKSMPIVETKFIVERQMALEIYRSALVAHGVKNMDSKITI
jgi:hypothetical protein